MTSQFASAGSGWLRGVAASALGASVFGLLSAALDARFAASGGAGGFALFLASAGLIAPLCLGLGLVVGLARALLADGAGPSPRAWRAALGALDADGRHRAAALALGGALAVLLWLVSVANVAARLLATDLPAAGAGAALAAGSVALGWALSAIVVGAADASAPRLSSVRPERAIAAAVAIVALGLGLAVATGHTSGSGGPFSIFGVFRRPELDLRGPALLALVTFGAAIVPRPRGRLAAAVLGALALVPLLATAHGADRALGNRQVALAVERGAPLGKHALALARSLTDRDGDGAAARFGGGDCDDSDPAVGPHAVDVPGNGLDEDCSGADEAVPPAVAQRPADDRPASLRDRLPENLGVVLISIDTLRWDVGYMGYSRPITPNIDALAKKSVVFERAYALASYTAKSLGPMMIGKYAGETDRGFSHFNRFPKTEQFVQERLQKAGVFTASVQGYWYFFQNSGFERGFDVIDSSAAPKVAKVEGDNTFNSDKISDAALEVVRRPELADRPFFVWIHYVDPHSEYVRHAEFDFGSSPRDRYDSEVAFVDHHVGRVIDAIAGGPLGGRTAIVVTSDHGEAFGEHGMIRHGFELWEELVRVPLVVHVPGLAPRRIGVRRSTIDVVPTILDLLRVEPPSGQGRDFVSGKSLLVDLFSPDGHTPEERPIYIDMAAGPHNADRQGYIEGDKKLVLSGARPLSLFDLKADPGEKNDLLDQAAVADPVLARFKAFRSTLRPVRVKPTR